MDFRMYDNAIGKFYGMDALSEKNHYLSPFQFGNGNPVIYSDPSGLDALKNEHHHSEMPYDNGGMEHSIGGGGGFDVFSPGGGGGGGKVFWGSGFGAVSGQPTEKDILNFIMSKVSELNINKIYYKVNDNGSITYSYMKEFSVSHKYLEDGADLIGITVGLKKMTETVFLGEKSNSAFDIDKAVNHLNDNANNKSKGKCARYVRQALNAGGLEGLSGHAFQYYKSGKLEGKGFRIISQNNSNISFQKGDISVFDRTGNRQWGHIAMYNGTQWVSDFRQKSLFVHSDYVNSNTFVIYRFIN